MIKKKDLIISVGTISRMTNSMDFTPLGTLLRSYHYTESVKYYIEFIMP